MPHHSPPAPKPSAARHTYPERHSFPETHLSGAPETHCAGAIIMLHSSEHYFTPTCPTCPGIPPFCFRNLWGAGLMKREKKVNKRNLDGCGGGGGGVTETTTPSDSDSQYTCKERPAIRTVPLRPRGPSVPCIHVSPLCRPVAEAGLTEDP